MHPLGIQHHQSRKISSHKDDERIHQWSDTWILDMGTQTSMVYMIFETKLLTWTKDQLLDE